MQDTAAIAHGSWSAWGITAPGGRPVGRVDAVCDERQADARQRAQAELAQHLHVTVAASDEHQVLRHGLLMTSTTSVA